MPLYAQDADDLVFAADAHPEKAYKCLECSLPLQLRRAPGRVPHFYHRKTSPACRLYSKSEEHLLLQVQLQKLIPDAILERPFRQIRRIADLAWEKEKIIFEIQCSKISVEEATQRIEEYGSLGYEVIWILDDRKYNQWALRPVEPLLRKTQAFFATFRRHTSSLFYDQFEICTETRRLKKSRPLPIALSHPSPLPLLDFPSSWPSQVQQRTQRRHYFPGDLVDLALRSSSDIRLQNWALLEKELPPATRGSKYFKSFWNPLMERLNAWLIRKG